jgi:hypothetical protein
MVWYRAEGSVPHYCRECRVSVAASNADRIGHRLGPDQLAGSEHYAVVEFGIYKSLNKAIDLLDRIAPDEAGNVP